MLIQYHVDFGRDTTGQQDLHVRITYETVDEHSNYTDILARTRLKEKFTHRARKALKIKESTIDDSGTNVIGEDTPPKSPAFVIADSPLQKSKGSSEKGSLSDLTSAGKKVEVKTRGVFFNNSAYKEVPTPSSFGTIESNEAEEDEEEPDAEVDMEEYLKSLENK